MHRVEGENTDDSVSGKPRYRTTAPFTVVKGEHMNAIQEELMNCIEQFGLPLLSQGNDTHTQLWEAITGFVYSVTLPHDYIVYNQDSFEALFVRSGANQYQFSGSYKSIYFKGLPSGSGYVFSSVLSGGDTWGDILTNLCNHLEFENGAYIDFGVAKGNLTVETEKCLLENVDLRGSGSTASAITESFLLAASFVTFRNCRCSDRTSNVATSGFRGSGTTLHNETSRYIGCSVADMETTHASKVIQPFVDGTKNKKACVSYNLDNTGQSQRFEDPEVIYTTARQVGSSLAISTWAGRPALATLNSTDVAFYDAALDSLRTYRFDGSAWSVVGSGLSITSNENAALVGLTTTDVAFIDGQNDELRLYRFDGSNWSLVGSGLSIAGVTNDVSMARMNDTDVAFFDTSNAELRYYSFDGSNWSLVGSGLSIPSASTPFDISALSGTDVAFWESTSKEIRTYRFDGANWSQIGSGLNLPSSIDVALSAMSSKDIVFCDNATDRIRTFRFDGSTWYATGYTGIPISGGLTYARLTRLNETDFALCTLVDSTLRTYRFDFRLEF